MFQIGYVIFWSLQIKRMLYLMRQNMSYVVKIFMFLTWQNETFKQFNLVKLICLIKRLYIIGSNILTMIFCNELKFYVFQLVWLVWQEILTIQSNVNVFCKMYIIAQSIVVFAKKTLWCKVHTGKICFRHTKHSLK